MNRLYRGNMAQLLLEHKYPSDPYGGSGLTKMLFFEELAEAGEKELYCAAQWFILPHPKGRDHQGEPDFTANKLIRAVYMLENKLSDKTVDAIHAFFTEWDFESKYKSENHMILFHESRYLYALKYPEQFFHQYQKSALEILEEDRNFLRDFICFRAKCGWAEFDSLGYAAESFLALLNLIDFGETKMSNYARMSADLLLMDMLVDCNKKGYYGGAHGRSYERMVLNYENAPMYKLYQYYFTEEISIPDSIEMIASNYVPSDYVYELFYERPDCWENYECKHLHSITYNTPHEQVPQVPGKIQKYTYVTPKYVMGAVNHQDKYPKDSPAAWYAHHQQHEWDVSLVSGSDMRIFVHHPGSNGPEGKEHGYWTGDLGCGCGQYYCYKNVVMATHDIPEKEEPMIHAHIPLKKLNTVLEENYLWFEDSACELYGMLWLSNGFDAGSEKYKDIELRSYGRKHGVVCMIGTKEEYEDFSTFCQAVKQMPILYDPQNDLLNFGNMAMRKGERMYKGKKVQFKDMTYDSPLMHSEWNSGIVYLNHVILDFNEWGTVRKR